MGFFTETYLPELNGTSVTLAYAKKELERAGHEVYIFAPKVKGYQEKDPTVMRLNSVKLVASEPEQRMALPIPNESFRKTLRVKLDLVHAHGGGSFSFLGYQLALAKGYPFILTYHAFLKHYTHYFLNGRLVNPRMVETASRVFCNQADVVIAPTEKMKVELESYGVTKPIEVVSNVFDLSQFGQAKKGFLHKKLKIDSGRPILLTVSRLGKEKNIDFLFRSFARVAKKDASSVFVVVGDGPEKENLKKLAQKLKISSRVKFTGYVSKESLPEVYADAEIFLFASKSETQGMVIPEAAASGLPFVVVQDQAFVGVVEDGRNGFEIKGKESDFAQKVLELLKNTEKRKAFGDYSKQLIKENFSVEDSIDKLIKVYEQAREIRAQKPRLSNKIQGRVKDFASLFKVVKELNKRIGFFNGSDS
ncbi:MAG: glycosyltransferase [bacterium]|nr:glycosyltransferase [bacterium]